MDIQANIEFFRKELPPHVKLVAITKTKSIDEILQAYRAGHRFFGENKVQELVQKQQELPADIEWHMVGHLQSNKVKYIAPFIHLIHSIDSLKLLEIVNKEALKNNRVIACLLQIHISAEETKFGFSDEELNDLLQSGKVQQLSNIRICGLMGMASFSENEALVRGEFNYLKELFNKIKSSYFSENSSFKELSMGMSGDYKIAVSEGSTIVRIGSLIFGERL